MNSTPSAPVRDPVPVFETARLVLRELVLEDAPAYERQFVDYEVIRHLNSMVPWPYPKHGVVDYLTSNVIPAQGLDRWVWAIALKESPAELIGVVDLWRAGRPDHRGVWLGRDFWGRGYMTEAVEPVMDHAFGPLGFEKLILSNAAGNSRSARVKAKMGARLIGRTPSSFVDPVFTESELWEITREEWKAFKRSRG